LKKMFKISRFYSGPVPTYPVGTWCYNFLSDRIDPLKVKELRIPAGLKYYNEEIHRAAFAQPAFFKQATGQEIKKGKFLARNSLFSVSCLVFRRPGEQLSR